MFNFMGNNYGLYDTIPNPNAPNDFANAPAHSLTPTGAHARGPQAAVAYNPVGQHPTAPQGQNFLAQQQQAQAQYQQNLKLAEALRAQQAASLVDNQNNGLGSEGNGQMMAG